MTAATESGRAAGGPLPSRHDLHKAYRYARGLWRFWRAPFDPSAAARTIRRELAEREQRAADWFHRAVYAHPETPCAWLLRTAGLEEGDLAALLQQEGLDGALERLYHAGVYISLDEFKGRTDVLRRGSQERELDERAFENPLTAGDVAGTSGASRSSGTPLSLDLDDVLQELPIRYLHRQAHGITGWPFIMWRPVNALSALRHVLIQAKMGARMLGWFTPTRAAGADEFYLNWSSLLISRLQGHPLTRPRYAPLDDPGLVARWLAERKAEGTRVAVYTSSSAAARLAVHALENGVDIAGHHCWTTAEPLTEERGELLRRAGISWSMSYGLTETGTLAVACGHRTHSDEAHVAKTRQALITVPRTFPYLEAPADTLWVTTFSPHAPRIMLNLETGDYATRIGGSCGCALEAAGLTQRIHTIRSYEKLTSEGMNFMGSALLDVLETVLPARYGGGPIDYQFVEREESGRARVHLVVSPRLGPLDEADLVACVLEELSARTRAGHMQVEMWRSGDVLQVVRAEPELTRAGKILPLHVASRSAPRVRR